MSALIQQYFTKMKNIEKTLLEFLDKQDNCDKDFEKIINFLDQQKILDNKDEFIMFLRIIREISCYHYRSNFLNDKIEMIINEFKEDIMKIYSNEQIFHFFKKSKRIILSLLEQKILILNDEICKIINNSYELIHYQSYYSYFYPELSTFSCAKKYYNENPEIIDKVSKDLKDLKKFKEKRRIGENDNKICEIIRNDNLNEFISFTSKNDIDIKGYIRSSIFETNKMLYRCPSFFCYAAFFGSAKIFNYILQNINDSKVVGHDYEYALHGQNKSIIDSMEEKINVIREVNEYIKKIIKFHINIPKKLVPKKDFTELCLKRYNFISLDENMCDAKKILFDYCRYDCKPDNFYVFNWLCSYDYSHIVNILFQNLELNKFTRKNLNTAMFSAIYGESEQIVEMLLETDIDINFNNKVILFILMIKLIYLF